MKSINQRIDQLLVEAIEEVLSFLGEPVKNQVFAQLEKDLSITQAKLPERIEDFSRFLYRFFGSHAKLVEIDCVKAFYSKVKENPEIVKTNLVPIAEDFTLPSYVNKFRKINMI